ncbi:hypothetical protein ACTFIR_007755 [Dictyostelium discoideum]
MDYDDYDYSGQLSYYSSYNNNDNNNNNNNNNDNNNSNNDNNNDNNDNIGKKDDGKIIIILNVYQIIGILINSSRLDDIFKIPKLHQIINNVLDHAHIPLPLVERLLENPISSEIGFSVQTFLRNLVLYGNLPIIKFLILNYSHIFLKKASKGRNLETKDLKNLLLLAIRYDFPQIAEILFVYVKVTSVEFKKEVPPKDFSLVTQLFFKDLN